MTELRKGQRATIEVVIEDPMPDEDGDICVRLPYSGEGSLCATVPAAALHFGPSWHDRREAMVRAVVANPSYVSPNIKPYHLAEKADRLLRATDETPVPDQQPREYRVVFDGPPAPESGRFIEVEDEHGRSRKFGEWVECENGYWELRLPRGGEHE